MKEAVALRLAWLALVAIGIYLRLWRLEAQIPLDDEWHAIAYVAEHDLGYLLTHFTRMGANSIPHNVYLRLVYDTVGLSEWTLALPSLAAGIMLLWLYPRWIGQRVGAAAGLVSAALLAFAPFLIHYSRFARPYAPLLLAEFLAIRHLLAWMRGARRWHASYAVGFSSLAVWLQVSAAAPIAGIWIAASWWQWRERRRLPTAAPGSSRILAVALLMTATTALLYLPALLYAANPAPPATSPFTASTANAVTQLVFGSARVDLRILLGCLAAVGVVLTARRAAQELAIIAAAAATPVGVILLVHPFAAEVGAAFVRYSLPIFLLVPLAVGAVVQWAIVERLPSPALRWVLGSIGLAGLAGMLYLCGPLPSIYASNASFTKHPALQYQYTEVDPESSAPDPASETLRPIARSQLHPFYALLRQADTSSPIIEYPFLVGAQMNRFYFAQWLHRQPVLAGYYRSGMAWSDRFGLALAQGPGPVAFAGDRGFLTADMAVDQALQHVASRSGIRLRTVVDLDDPEAIRASGARYVVLHWNLPREFLFLEVSGELGGARTRFVAHIAGRLAAAFGRPIVSDQALTVFKVR